MSSGSDTGQQRVSVLLPVYNGEAHLERALSSVLAQTMTGIELVVVDDGSVDATPEILDRHRDDDRLKILRKHRNEGLVAALNDGLDHCSGELVARLDADDVAHPNRLARQVAAFERDPGLVLCATAYRMVSPDGTLIRVGTPPEFHAELVLAMIGGNRISHPSVMYRRSSVLAVGGYDPRWFPVEDYDLWFRLLAHGRFVGLPEIELTYEARPGSISAQRAEEQASLQVQRSVQELLDVLGEEADPEAARAIASGGGGSIIADLASLRLLRRYVDLVAEDLTARGVPVTGIVRQERMQMSRVLSRRSRGFRRMLVDSMLLIAPRRETGARRR